MVATFKLKAPAKNPVLISNGVQCKALILKSNSLSTVHSPTSSFMSRHMLTPTLEAAFGKGRMLRLGFRRQAVTLPPLPWSNCAAFSI